MAKNEIWRTITLGTYKGVDAYRDALDSAGIKIGNAADEILGRPAFPYTGMKTDVELALLSAVELGVESESSFSDLYKRAKQVGLELCPAEVAPQLRLDYRNQPLSAHARLAPLASPAIAPPILPRNLRSPRSRVRAQPCFAAKRSQIRRPNFLQPYAAVKSP